MNKKELEEYKKLGEKLICVPSGLKRKDGTDIMSWSLREWFEERPEENDTYVEYENTIEEETQDYYLIKEDEEQYNPKSNSITNSEHDKLFKKLLENREQTAKFLDMVLGSGKDITAKNLELYNKEFITDKFEKNETDIVYKVTNINVYIIIEHQSTADRTMPYRVRRYKTALMDSVINKKEMKKASYKLPRMIAIVLYTGKQKWENLKLEDMQEPLEWYREDYNEFILVDVNSFKKEEILEGNLIITKAMLLEREENPEDFIKYLYIIIDREKIKQDIQYKELLKILIQYIFINERYASIRKKIETTINKIFDEEGDDETMSHFTQLLDEAFDKAEKRGEIRGEIRGEKRGKKEGREEGKIEVAKAMKADKVSYEIISKFTGLKLEEIEAL